MCIPHSSNAGLQYPLSVQFSPLVSKSQPSTRVTTPVKNCTLVLASLRAAQLKSVVLSLNLQWHGAREPSCIFLDSLEVADAFPVGYGLAVGLGLGVEEVSVVGHHVFSERRTRQFTLLESTDRILQAAWQHQIV